MKLKVKLIVMIVIFMIMTVISMNFLQKKGNDNIYKNDKVLHANNDNENGDNDNIKNNENITATE